MQTDPKKTTEPPMPSRANPSTPTTPRRDPSTREADQSIGSDRHTEPRKTER